MTDSFKSNDVGGVHRQSLGQGTSASCPVKSNAVVLRQRPTIDGPEAALRARVQMESDIDEQQLPV
jgi:hypothetical protein